MKKIWCLIFAVLMLLSTTACSVEQQDNNTPTAPSYAGKTAVFVGDSITNGAELNEGDQSYWQLLQNDLQFRQVIGMGVNGSCYSTKSEFGLEHSPLATRYEQIPNADLIFIFLGTNDFGRCTPMGNIEDKEDISFYGAMNMILNALEQQCPDSKIILLTPIVRYDKVKNNLGLKLVDYVNAIKAVAEARNLPVVDMHALTKASLTNKVFSDLVHPNNNGHQILADTLENWLKDNMDTILK